MEVIVGKQPVVEYETSDDFIYISSNLTWNKVRLRDPDVQTEFLSLVQNGSCEALTTPLTNFLHEQELLLCADEIRDALNKVKALLSEVLQLTILPTEACNFRCPYCYENHDAVTMTPELLSAIQAFVKSHISEFKFLNISWFGGEPTLCKNTILDFSAFVQGLQKDFEFSYRSGMTTNGYLLELDSFRQYYDAGITSYQITLDGWNHDQTRPHVSGKGTLQTILNNLKSISALSPSQYHFSILLRHNILAGDHDFSWYDHLYELFGDDPRFELSVQPVSDWGGSLVKNLSLISKEDQQTTLAAHKEYIHKIGLNLHTVDNGMFSQICYASYPYGFVFRADGRIEKCTIALDCKENEVGRITPEFGVVLYEKANSLWSKSTLREECYTCPDVLRCLNLQCRRSSLIQGKRERCNLRKEHTK